MERLLTGPVPTRWLAQMDGQLADAERRIEAAAKQLTAGAGGPAIEEAYPGVMAAAMVRVWLRDVFDPARRANPAKVVPVRSCREWTMAPAARA